MGRHEPYKVQPHARLSRGKLPLITTLINSVLYFLESAFIVVEGNRCRLIVYHNNEVLADDSYETLRGAKIAFSKLFQYKAFLDSKAEWSPLYPPEKEWLDGMLTVCREYLRGNVVSRPMEYAIQTASQN